MNEFAEKNGVSQIFRILGWAVFIIGFVVGLVSVRNGVGIAVMIAYWCATLFGGTVLFGFGEIIQLLEDIKKGRK